jgi:hypothetical protein
VADGWCWFVLREKYCWLVAGDWFVLREKHCWLVADKPSEQADLSARIFVMIFAKLFMRLIGLKSEMQTASFVLGIRTTLASFTTLNVVFVVSERPGGLP